jgi:hypothetical protein
MKYFIILLKGSNESKNKERNNNDNWMPSRFVCCWFRHCYRVLLCIDIMWKYWNKIEGLHHYKIYFECIYHSQLKWGKRLSLARKTRLFVRWCSKNLRYGMRRCFGNTLLHREKYFSITRVSSWNLSRDQTIKRKYFLKGTKAKRSVILETSSHFF